MTRRSAQTAAIVAAVLLVTGAILSRQVEPGVRVEHVTLAGDAPALHFAPSTTGNHPVALLAHGVTASKETLFRFGEALASAGFDCYAFDFPGHGESPRPFRPAEIRRTIELISKELGTIDVFLGHSMGAYVGAESVRTGRLSPRIFIAVGAAPDLDEKAQRVLFLAGRFEEAVSLDSLRSRNNAPLVISPWSDHALEPYDPILVRAAVEGACATAGLTPPASPTRWLLRLAGLLLCIPAAIVLGHTIATLVPRLSKLRGPLLALLTIGATALSATSWVGAAPVLRRIPLQLVFAGAFLVIIAAAAKSGIPRWSFAAAGAALCLCFAVAGIWFLALLSGLFTLVLAAGTILGWIAALRGTHLTGDLALAIFAGYALGQWMPMPF